MSFSRCSSCGQDVYCLINEINSASFCFTCLDKYHSEFLFLNTPRRKTLPSLANKAIPFPQWTDRPSTKDLAA